MLQRIQTIFMIIAAISMTLVLFFPIWEKSDQDFDAKKREYTIMNSFDLRHEQHDTTTAEIAILGRRSTIPISVGTVVSALVMFWSISRYKNRKTQVKLNALFSLLSAGTFVGIYVYINKANALFDPAEPGQFLIGFYLPVIAMFSNFLANRFIRKDEKLVRSMDRLR